MNTEQKQKYFYVKDYFVLMNRKIKANSVKLLLSFNLKLKLKLS